MRSTNTCFSTPRSDGDKLCRGIYGFDIEEYERAFWDEIYGCMKYVGLPYDTLMSMPIQDRKVWIMKHNMAQRGEAERERNQSGDFINSYASLEQENLMNRK